MSPPVSLSITISPQSIFKQNSSPQICLLTYQLEEPSSIRPFLKSVFLPCLILFSLILLFLDTIGTGLFGLSGEKIASSIPTCSIFILVGLTLHLQLQH